MRKLPLHWGRWLRQCYWLMIRLTSSFPSLPAADTILTSPAQNIPGTANGSLPDSTLHYVPFTYAGTVDAYKLTTEMATTEEHAQQNKYPHSLFVADYAVTNDVSWNAAE